MKSVAYHREISQQLKALGVSEVQLVGSLDHRRKRNGKLHAYLDLLHAFYVEEGFEVRAWLREPVRH